MRKVKPKSKALYNGMSNSAKDAARDFIVDYTISSNDNIKTIFSLPSRDGHCVTRFRELWPDAEIVGLEQNSTIVKTSHLMRDGILNQYYAGVLNDFISSTSMPTQALRGLINENFEMTDTPVYSGMFDFSFLDFTGFVSTFKRDTIEFIDKFVSDGVVAITFSFDQSKDKTVQLDDIKNEINDKFGKQDFSEYIYNNLNSEMFVLIFKKSCNGKIK